MSKRLYIIRGLPGSGKTTWSRLRHANVPRLEADMYFVSAKGVYEFDPERLHAAHKWCIQTAKIMLNNGVSVCVSNTFTTMAELRPYLSMAQSCGATVEITELTQNFGSIHGVPREALARMALRWDGHDNTIDFVNNSYPGLGFVYRIKDDNGIREIEPRDNREHTGV